MAITLLLNEAQTYLQETQKISTLLIDELCNKTYQINNLGGGAGG